MAKCNGYVTVEAVNEHVNGDAPFNRVTKEGNFQIFPDTINKIDEFMKKHKKDDRISFTILVYDCNDYKDIMRLSFWAFLVGTGNYDKSGWEIKKMEYRSHNLNCSDKNLEYLQWLIQFGVSLKVASDKIKESDE